MIPFEVNDMSCGHCVNAVTRAAKSVDGGATVEVNLGTKRVRIAHTRASAPQLAAALRDAGYTPVLVNDAPAPSET
jgi:copper chaperone